MSNPNPIRLVVCDIDGVLTEGETRALDLDLLGYLARLNRLSQKDPAVPAITICSGRPAQYVELMLQAIDGRIPGVFENGAGLYIPETYRFLPHPALSDGNVIPAVRKRLEETLVRSGEAYFQPGKEYSLSLFASDPGAIAGLYQLATSALGDLKETVDLVYSTSCLNVLPRNVDKGKGVKFLSDLAGYALSQMLGLGDSDVDLPFLALVGHSAAPANAIPAVKSAVQYISPFRTEQGVRDILKHFKISIP
ncbi:MAG TPA: HAD family hydrolase [Anaerolineales bacterium]|jgi:hydroxymethylpyrimidine pyrophosphatase-like HAD family hydrolase|nr:HAD family hydrolase [Anaerolineales bacterium]